MCSSYMLQYKTQNKKKNFSITLHSNVYANYASKDGKNEFLKHHLGNFPYRLDPRVHTGIDTIPLLQMPVMHRGAPVSSVHVSGCPVSLCTALRWRSRVQAASHAPRAGRRQLEWKKRW